MKNHDKLDEKIQELVDAVVNSVFSQFENAQDKSPHFSWEDFPELMKSLAKAHSASLLCDLPLDIDRADIKTQIGEKAFLLAQEKVDQLQGRNNSPKP